MYFYISFHVFYGMVCKFRKSLRRRKYCVSDYSTGQGGGMKVIYTSFTICRKWFYTNVFLCDIPSFCLFLSFFLCDTDSFTYIIYHHRTKWLSPKKKTEAAPIFGYTGLKNWVEVDWILKKPTIFFLILCKKLWFFKIQPTPMFDWILKKKKNDS